MKRNSDVALDDHLANARAVQAFGWDDPEPTPDRPRRKLHWIIYALACGGIALAIALPFMV